MTSLSNFVMFVGLHHRWDYIGMCFFNCNEFVSNFADVLRFNFASLDFLRYGGYEIGWLYWKYAEIRL